MWQRFTFQDLRSIAHYLGVLITYFSIAYALPILVALLFQEWEALARYILAVGTGIVVGTVLRLCRVQPGKLTSQQALVLVGIAWLVLAGLSSLPLYSSGHYASYLDALFEGVSGLTTTGASLVVDIEHLSMADNMWRFTMHFIGGLGLAVVALSLGFMGRGVSGMYGAEGRSEHVVPSVVNTTRLIARIAIVIVMCTALLLTAFAVIGGMEPSRAFFHCLWIAITDFVTGGFAPVSQSIAYYHSFPMECVSMVIMLLGSISFALFVAVWKGKTFHFFADFEIRAGAIWLLAVGAIFIASLIGSSLFSDLPALMRRGVFMLIAASTTTGLQNITGDQLVTMFSSGAFFILAILMAVGGSSGSTAGGIKLSRIGLVAKSAVSTIKESLSPDSACISVTYYHLGKRILSTQEAKTAMTVSALFIITYLLGSLAGIAHGYDASMAIFEAVAMGSNGGLTSGIATQGMPPTLELIYILEMWAGRLEIITLVALIVKVVVSLIPNKKVELEL
ncbi:MAG: TrkH family potassium uptake protein [Anaerotardibacter sp.]